MIESDVVMGLGSLIKKYEFSIPDYQRGYEWELSNVDDFHKDLKTSRISGQIRFVGSLILKRETPGAQSVELVDGQQRITTIFLYLSVIRDLLANLSIKELPPSGISIVPLNPSSVVEDLNLNFKKTAYRLQPNDLISELYLKHVAPNPKGRLSMPRKHKAYSKDFRRAYARIENLLSEEIAQLGGGSASEIEKLRFLNDYVGAITENLQALAIYTDNDAEALEIFMTMNTKGVSLAASDIVKSLIFRSALAGTPEIDKTAASEFLLQQWRILLDSLEGANLDQVLRHYFLGITKNTFTMKGLIKRTQELIEIAPLSHEQNASALLRDLLNMASNYRLILDAAIVNCGSASDSIN